MKHLPFKSAKRKWLESFEKKYFSDILQEFNGNISKAARKARIDRQTLKPALLMDFMSTMSKSTYL